ncbi:TetR family transcriptional regulator [Duganella sp. FT135W]|uniref:TetR family transcriptional regulator n=1 Tax=Duganella flavida TaxID=2692175 RepID=A0A6L8K4S8_9BURK|nr:TetR/AcrR family transcriptional regulator [Duganella flavida]MYM21925.1 TetR family transcriptional regulator [Duganella flavida]
MQYSDEQREEARQRLLSGIGRGFRRHGYSGIGVDGLAKAAGVTSGAFYSHFRSKTEAFERAVIDGMDELAQGVAGFQLEYGADWIVHFVDFYLGVKRTCDLGQACALQSLGPEIMRAGDDARGMYQRQMMVVIEQVALKMPHATAALRTERAWALMSLLSGAVIAARSMQDAAVSDHISAAARQAALMIAAA